MTQCWTRHSRKVRQDRPIDGGHPALSDKCGKFRSGCRFSGLSGHFLYTTLRWASSFWPKNLSHWTLRHLRCCCEMVDAEVLKFSEIGPWNNSGDGPVYTIRGSLCRSEVVLHQWRLRLSSQLFVSSLKTFFNRTRHCRVAEIFTLCHLSPDSSASLPLRSSHLPFTHRPYETHLQHARTGKPSFVRNVVFRPTGDLA